MSKVCIIGLDGGTFIVIDYLVKQGRLPNFARVMEEGSRAGLMSTIPPITPAAWASFYTGTNPGKSGVVDFFKWRGGSYRLAPVNSGTVNGAPLWTIASNYGKRVCVYNVPVTWPATPVNGILISGMDAPHLDEKAVYPAEFRQKLLDKFPDFAIESSVDYKYLVNNHPDPVGECIKELDRHLQLEMGVIRFLMGLEDWDLFVGVIRSPDSFQHIFWNSMEKMIRDDPAADSEDIRRAESVFNCYEKVDSELGAVWTAWGTDRDILMMSDHGFGLLEKEVCMNRILAEAGLLNFKRTSRKTNAKEQLKNKMRAYIPKATRNRIKRAVGRDTGRNWDTFVDALIADIDWSRTRLCSISQFGCLFANIKGRHPLGTVDGQADLESVLAEAAAALREIRDPIDGKPAITKMYRKEEIYNGPMIDEMPEMVVVMRNYAYRGIHSTRFELSEEGIIRPPRRERKQLAHTGNHRREGMLILFGPDIGHKDLGKAGMADIAPTVMNLLGLPGREDYDGSLLDAAMASGARDVAVRESDGGAFDVTRSDDVYTEDDEEEVRKRLEDLGYL